MSAIGEAAPRSGNGRDDASWVDVNVIRPKMKKIHVVDSAGTNEW
jgi:hypothetical protein